MPTGGHVPSLYVLNIAALTKPHAVEQLAVDLGYSADVAVITETHLKVKHVDGVMNIPDFTLFRRDRHRRRGGGVAVYVRSVLQPALWTYSADNQLYELLWVRVGSTVIGALPPADVRCVIGLHLSYALLN